MDKTKMPEIDGNAAWSKHMFSIICVDDSSLVRGNTSYICAFLSFMIHTILLQGTLKTEYILLDKTEL